LRDAARAGELTSVVEAERSFREIHSVFVAETQQLKSKSVRESRLAHQADLSGTRPDSLRYLFNKEVLPEVLKAKKNATTFQQLIPEFATGGLFRGAGLAILHDGELILNHAQQRRVQALAGADVFRAAGVPNAPSSGPFQSGGYYSAPAPPQLQAPVLIIEKIEIANSFKEEDGPRLAEMIVRTPEGRRFVYKGTSDGRKEAGLGR